jgi:hypothetical protein
MAGRPHKQGLDFFSWAVDFEDDEKISDLYEAHGDSGLMFFIRMLCFIYKRGNHIEWNKTNRLLFVKRNPYNLSEVDLYLPALIQIGLLSQRLYEKYDILTSSGIQERYLYMTKRRETVVYIKEYLLIDLDSYKAVRHNVEVKSVAGETLKKYIPPAAGEKQKPKSKSSAKKDIVKPDQAYTVTDLRKELAEPYSDKSDEFKGWYNETEWASFIQFNQILDARFQQIRVSDYQLKISEFVELVETNNPTSDELQASFTRMLGLGIKKDISIYHRLITCLEFIRNKNIPAKPGVPQNGEPTIDDEQIFYRDKEFEEKVMRFFYGDKWSNFHQQLVLFVQFSTVMFNKGILDDFRESFDDYSKYKTKSGSIKHNFNTFLGSQEKQFIDGAWDKENWKLKLEERINQNNHGGKKPTEGRTGVKKDHGNI